jgi:hypothetical protein
MEERLAAVDPLRWERDLTFRLEVTRECCDLLETVVFPEEGGRLTKFLYLVKDMASLRKALKVIEVWIRNPGRAFRAMEQVAPHARVLAVGHTHLRGIWLRGGRIVINTGGFVSFPRAHMVEWADRRVRVYAVKEREGIFAPGRIHFERRIDEREALGHG